MQGSDSGESNSSSHDEVMRATYRALCEHGYADLTMQDIADECGKSKSLLHYHYDTKDELLTSFLEYLLDRLIDLVEAPEHDTPRAKLDAVVDALLFGPEDPTDFQTAMLEMRAQVPHREPFRRQFVEDDDHVHALLASIVEEGIESGQFAGADADRVANVLLVLIEGARTRAVILDDPDQRRIAREAIETYVEAELLGSGGEG